MPLEKGHPAPDFALPSLDGRTYRLSEGLASGPVLLAFVKTGCGACDLALPYLERLAAAYSAQGLQLWVISQHPPERIGPYARQMGLTVPVLVDADGFPASSAYDPPATPTLCLVGRDGKVAFYSHGFAKEDLNRLAEVVSDQLGAEALTVAPADDGRPPFRPG
ncbi:MAG TPA: TlpA disulfide reductase family protein [Dehalococcoidia bacterium]|nr:TlpA disulfide reductase family protein [Dehalococcoidia bacterium]